MSSRDRGAVAKDVIASIVVAGALAVGAAVAHAAPAARSTSRLGATIQ